MLKITSEVLTTPSGLLRLWKHECTRVIADRFVNQQDTDWFTKALNQMVEEDFGGESATVVESEPYFVDFLRDAPEITGTLQECTVK